MVRFIAIIFLFGVRRPPCKITAIISDSKTEVNEMDLSILAFLLILSLRKRRA